MHSTAAEKIAKAIAESREAAGISQRVLAERLDWPHSVIGMMESQQRHVRVAELIAIAEALGVPPEKIFRRCLR